MKRNLFVITLLVVVLATYLNNASFLAKPIGTAPFLIAHRALGQDFDRTGLTATTCTAARMIPSGHTYLENTLPAMHAAFAYGADAIELDVHWTTDRRFAVFHDWTVDCRTEGEGVTREQTLAELQALDVGYGYTADGGETWPFRGQGIGMMPSLSEVLTTFPTRTLVIDIKGNDPTEGALLAERLAALPPEQTDEIMVYGGPLAVAQVEQALPGIRTITRPRLKSCLLRYFALGWSGYVPEACRRAMLTVPANVAPWLWGWPNRFLQRIARVDTLVVLIGDYNGEGFSNGFNDPALIAELPTDYSGAIWTDRIDLLGPALK